MAKLKKSRFETTSWSVADAISSGFSELQSLGEEAISSGESAEFPGMFG